MNKRKIKIAFVLFLLVAIIGVLVYEAFIYEPKPVPNPNADHIYEEDYLNSNCDCIARERLACGFQGYELVGKLCMKESNITNPIRKCSKYNCDGEIINYSG
jgi:hypothetical protein